MELGATGRIDRDGLRALRDEIDQVRRAGIMAQQVVRLAGGEIQMQREHVNLSSLTLECLNQRAKEFELRGAEVHHTLAHASVVCDPSLCYSLVQTLLDWSLQHARSRIDLRVDIKSWPARARIACGFSGGHLESHGGLVTPVAEAVARRLNSVAWRLLEEIAQVQGLVLHRQDSSERTLVVIEFPETLASTAEGLQGLEADEPVLPSDGSRPLAGRHVLLLAPQLEVRNRVRDALQDMGLTLEVVASLAQVGKTGSSGLPHAVVYEASIRGAQFDIWRQRLVSQMPTTAFICIDDGERAFDVIKSGDIEQARVSRTAISTALPAALLFELTRRA